MAKKGPGLGWQFLEMWGISYPRARVEADAAPESEDTSPLCAACHNPADEVDGEWACPHHPRAGVINPPQRL